MNNPEEPSELREVEERLQADRREEKARRDAGLAHEAAVDAKIVENLNDDGD